jgi:hypothetical protein
MVTMDLYPMDEGDHTYDGPDERDITKVLQDYIAEGQGFFT